MNEKLYIDKKTDNIFNLLVLIENVNDDIEEVDIDEHIHSLAVEMAGATKTFPQLGENVDYITVLNMLYMLNSQVKFKEFRRSVLRMCSLLNKVGRKIGG